VFFWLVHFSLFHHNSFFFLQFTVQKLSNFFREHWTETVKYALVLIIVGGALHGSTIAFALWEWNHQLWRWGGQWSRSWQTPKLHLEGGQVHYYYYCYFFITHASSVMILNQRRWQSLDRKHGKGVDWLFEKVSFKVSKMGESLMLRGTRMQ